MPLTKQQKEEAVAAIAERLAGHNTVYLTDYAGLTVDKTNKLRRAFRDAGVEFVVLKNTLVRRAMQAHENADAFEGIFDQLNGPTAVAFTNDPAGPAKVIKKFNADNDTDLPRFKGAFVDGAVFGEGQLDALAALKSKDELLADILGLLMSPINNVAGALRAPGAGLASIVKQKSEEEA
jgi:large subunit ribosomal protein L10